MKSVRHESRHHEDLAGELIRALDAAVTAKCGHRMVLGIFLADPSDDEPGYLGWASNSPREDMVTLLLEWIGTQAPELVCQAVDRWKAQQFIGPGVERPQ